MTVNGTEHLHHSIPLIVHCTSARQSLCLSSISLTMTDTPKNGKDICPVSRQGSIDQDIGDVKDVVGEKKDVDAALQFLRSEGNVRPMTAEDEKKLKWKIDFMIMPLMFGCYCLQYLDKTLIK